MPEIHFDRFYRHAEITAFLKAFAAEHPDLVTLECIGKSFEGREIWVASITNRKTGEADQKPAMWLDGNIHSVELTASAACLYFLKQLVNDYGKDKRLTHCLDTRAFYICPRVNPDGAEAALRDAPHRVRSSMRPFPHTDEQVSGVRPNDVDGDGRVLYMRVEDPAGPWKPHADEPKLLVAREPDEFEGTFYRLYKEGEILEDDGSLAKHLMPREGLDLNRNFPADFAPEGKQRGAGLAPFSEPETRALGDFFITRKNIFMAIAGHTFSGVLLRPGSTMPDEDLPVNDLIAYKAMGNKGEELTGYPSISVYHDFRYHPKDDIKGTFDWVYDHLGIFTWTIEYWAPHRAAGLKVENYTQWLFGHSNADILQIFRFFEKEVPGQGYVDWYEFDHPKLGKVELGGWDIQNTFHNPPFHLLEKELSLFPDWFVYLALLSPKLELHNAEVKSLGGDSYLVSLTVENSGYLPTYGSALAKDHMITRDMVVEIDLPEGAKLVRGKPWQEVGHLDGRVGMMSSPVFVGTGFDPKDGSASRARAEWLIEAPKGAAVTVSARQERSGKVSAKLICK